MFVLLGLTVFASGLRLIPEQPYSTTLYVELPKRLSMNIPANQRYIATVSAKGLNRLKIYVRDGTSTIDFIQIGESLQAMLEPASSDRIVYFHLSVVHVPLTIHLTTKKESITPQTISKRREIVDVASHYDYYEFTSVCREQFSINAVSKNKIELVVADSRYPNNTDLHVSGTKLKQLIKVGSDSKFFIAAVKSVSKKCKVGVDCGKITITAMCTDTGSLAGCVL